MMVTLDLSQTTQNQAVMFDVFQEVNVTFCRRKGTYSEQILLSIYGLFAFIAEMLSLLFPSQVII